MNVKLTLKSLWLAVMLTVATAAMAQTKVTGIVYEPDGTTPVIGATVVQTGTNKGTSTDADGKFTLTVKGKKPVLRVSYVGFPATKVVVENVNP